MGLEKTATAAQIKKAYYLGYMVNKLLQVVLGRAKLDDRDSYVNKRVDLPGDLMLELFRQQWKKMLADCKKYFDTKNKGKIWYRQTPI